MNRRTKSIIALVMILFVLFSMSAFAQPAGELQSQTREFRPQANHTSSTMSETDLATKAPTYDYGSSVNGSYSDTFTSNNVSHVSKAGLGAGQHFIQYNYWFKFTSAPRANVVNLTWLAEGKVTDPSVIIDIYLRTGLSWGWTGKHLTSVESNQSESVNINTYMDQYGNTSIRFQAGSSSTFNISIDTVLWFVTYYPVGSIIYGNVVPSENANYTKGTLTSGGVWQTWLSNNSYQVSTSGQSGSSPQTSPTNWCGTGTQTASPWSGFAWSNPTYVQGASDNSGASSYLNSQGSSTNTLYAENFGFSLPSSATITGIVVTWRKYDTVSGDVIDYGVKIVKGGSVTGNNKASGSSWSTSYTDASYGGVDDTWGASFIYSDINAADFGSVISAYDSGSPTSTAYVDSCKITVYYSIPLYKLDCSYKMQFTTTDKSNVYQLGWLVNGKVSGNALTIYLYDWGSSTWNTTGKTLTSTQEDAGQSSVSFADYMANNGTVLIRFYLDAQSTSFTLSVDYMIINIAYSLEFDTTPPSTPVLISPGNGTVTDPYVVSFSWINSTALSGISNYTIQVSNSSTFSNFYLDEITSFSSYLVNTTTPLLFQWYYWRVRGVTNIGIVGNWSATHMFFPDTTLSISYYGASDGWGIPFSFPLTFVNGSQYSDPMIHLPNVYHHANITTMDYFGNIIAQRIYQINSSTVQYLNIPLQLVTVTFKAYDLSVCNVTYAGQPVKTLTFYDSVTTFLKPGTYSFTGTAWKGVISFNLADQVISTTLNRVIKLCDPPLIMTSVVFSQSDTAFSFSMAGNKPSPPFFFRVYDNASLIVPTTYAFSMIWVKSTNYGWHNLTLVVGDDVGYTFNFTASYFVASRSVHFEFFSSVDGLGLDPSLFQVYVNGSRIWDLNSYGTTGSHIFLQVLDYYMSSLYSSVLPYSSVIQVGLGYYQATFANNGENNIVLNSTADSYAINMTYTGDVIIYNFSYQSDTIGSMEFWFNPFSYSGLPTLFAYYKDANNFICGYIDSDGSINLETDFGGTYHVYQVSASGAVQLNQWSYIVLTENGTHFIAYVNGIAQTPVALKVWLANVTASPSLPLTVAGQHICYGTHALFRYYSGRAISQAEITYAYSYRRPQNSNGLAVWLPMNEGTGVWTYDISGNSKNGQVGSPAVWVAVADPPFVPVKSIPISAQSSTMIRMIAKSYTLVGFGIRTNNALVQFTSTTITVPTSSNVYTFHDLQSAIAFIKYVNANDPNLAAILPINFNTKYYEPSIGAWKWLSPYNPSITMMLSEKVNFTVYDNLGSVVINNQQYAYNETIQIPVIVFQVKIKSYGDNAFGAAILHRAGTSGGGGQVLLGESDIDTWYIYAGTYQLDIYYSFVVKNNRGYILDLWINKTYDITVANYPLYCAGILVANASLENIIDLLKTQDQGLTAIKIQLYPGGEVYGDMKSAVNALDGIGAQNARIDTRLWQVIIAMVAVVVLTFIGLWVATRAGHAKTEAEEKLETFMRNTAGKSALAGPHPLSAGRRRE